LSSVERRWSEESGVSLLSRQKTAETAKNSGGFAVISVSLRSDVQDFRDERETIRCKIWAKTAKTAE
jgi:hypothetical protein